MKFNLTKTESKIVSLVRDNDQYDLWIVGGAVRDLFLSKTPKDIDLVTNMPSSQVSSLLEDNGFKIIPDETATKHGITRIVDKDTGEPIDIATTRKDTSCDGRHADVEYTPHLREDLARRDLTINALAAKVNPDGTVDGTIFDHYNGQMDIRNKTLTFISNFNDRIREDYLRLIRLCRFTALGDGWEIGNPIAMIRSHADGINQISKERIRDEILKALSYPKPSNFFRALNDCGLLGYVFPEMLLTIGVEQNEYHDETVFEHLMYAVDASVDLTDSPKLRLAILCHDIGKPSTRSVDTDGRVHFYKHEVEGAKIVDGWMKEMKFSNKEIQYVRKLVRHHQWRFELNSRDKTIRHWLQDVGPEWRDLITVRAADRKGNMAKQHLPMITRKMKELMDRAQSLIDSGTPLFKEDLAINGDDLKKMGLKPGPVYKTIFSNMLGIVISDPEKNTREWLTNYVERNYINKSTNQAS